LPFYYLEQINLLYFIYLSRCSWPPVAVVDCPFAPSLKFASYLNIGQCTQCVGPLVFWWYDDTTRNGRTEFRLSSCRVALNLSDHTEARALPCFRKQIKLVLAAFAGVITLFPRWVDVRQVSRKNKVPNPYYNVIKTCTDPT
jgi:hypothetical protein